MDPIRGPGDPRFHGTVDPTRRDACRTLLGVGGMVFSAGALAAGPSLVIRHPAPESANDIRRKFAYQVLAMALDKTVHDAGPVTFAAANVPMSPIRTFKEQASGHIDLSVSTYLPPEYRDTLQVVPFPIDRGLNGQKVCIIRKETQALVDKVKSIDDLKAFPIIQSAQWVEVEILRNAGLTVDTPAVVYGPLMNWLNVVRGELLARSVGDIVAELKARPELSDVLTIEKNLLLQIQMARYYVVRKDASGESLKNRILEGLNRIQKDGSYMKAYATYKATALSGLKLKGRHVLRIPNSAYSAEYLTDKKEFWDDLHTELL